MIGELYTQVILIKLDRAGDKNNSDYYFNKVLTRNKSIANNSSNFFKTPLKSPERTTNSKDFLNILTSIKNSVLRKSKERNKIIDSKPPPIQHNMTLG